MTTNITKKIAVIITTILIATPLVFANITFAEEAAPPPETMTQEQMQEQLDALTQRIGKERTDTSKEISNLPSIGMEKGIATIIKTVLGWATIFTIIAIIVASIYFLTSQGKEESVTKAKDIIVYLIIGMIIMASAYGIISGIAQFDFFRIR